MLSLNGKAIISNDDKFIERVAMAVYAVCYDILEEDQEISDHIVRTRMAASFLQTPKDRITRFSNTVISHPEVAILSPNTQEDIPDALILKIVLKAWNGIAGILE